MLLIVNVLLRLIVLVLVFDAFTQPLGSQAFCQKSPLSFAEVESLFQQRARFRQEKDYVQADRILQTLLGEGVVINDYLSKWAKTTNREQIVKVENHELSQVSPLELCRASGKDSEIMIIDELRHRISEKKVHGRMFADCAFELSLAGFKNDEIFVLLTNLTILELRRYGLRKSCRPVDILQMMEKLAASGQINQTIYEEVHKILVAKGTRLDYFTGAHDLKSGRYSIFSERPLLWLWRNAGM